MESKQFHLFDRSGASPRLAFVFSSPCLSWKCDFLLMARVSTACVASGVSQLPTHSGTFIMPYLLLLISLSLLFF